MSSIGFKRSGALGFGLGIEWVVQLLLLSTWECTLVFWFQGYLLPEGYGALSLLVRRAKPLHRAARMSDIAMEETTLDE